MGSLKDAAWADVAQFISIVAGLMTILGIGGAVTWSLGRRLSSTFANRILLIAQKALKLGMIFLYLVLLFIPWEIFYHLIALDVLNSYPGPTSRYWNPEEPVPHLVAHGVSFLLFFAFAVTGSLCIYAGSLVPFKWIIRKWRSSGALVEGSLKGEIDVLCAEYGKDDTFLDVTEKVREFLRKDKLEFKVTNEIFGDPVPKRQKTLKLTLRVAGREVRREYKEGARVEERSNGKL